MLFRPALCHEVNSCEFSHGIAVVDSVLSRRVGQVKPDLKQIHPQHFLNAHGRTAALPLGVVGFDHADPLAPGNDLVHDFQKFLSLAIESPISSTSAFFTSTSTIVNLLAKLQT